ncbi:hypothetical protein WMY93_021565 [Mugilogobius chulae]|uniref:Lipocalin/cytosolic fatty-acid binding domain-containing protein n=1 Tax=Mugilogobius chulae TaxID=88201 RepID=A0AAW0NCB5_9GOBI
MLQTCVILIFCIGFGACKTHGASFLQDSSTTPQDQFSLERFLGRWFEVAVVSTCPHFMQRKTGNPAIVELNLQLSHTEGNITVTATAFRNESCKSTFTNYSLTETPGKFFYHVPKFSADVRVKVVDTNYVEYALMLLLSTERPQESQTLIVKLYSRTKDVSAASGRNTKRW